MKDNKFPSGIELYQANTLQIIDDGYDLAYLIRDSMDEEDERAINEWIETASDHMKELLAEYERYKKAFDKLLDDVIKSKVKHEPKDNAEAALRKICRLAEQGDISAISTVAIEALREISSDDASH